MASLDKKHRMFSHGARLSVIAGVTFTIVATALLLWDLGYGPLTNTWDSGYAREGWQAIVVLALAGTGLISLGALLASRTVEPAHDH